MDKNKIIFNLSHILEEEIKTSIDWEKNYGYWRYLYIIITQLTNAAINPSFNDFQIPIKEEYLKFFDGLTPNEGVAKEIQYLKRRKFENE